MVVRPVLSREAAQDGFRNPACVAPYERDRGEALPARNPEDATITGDPRLWHIVRRGAFAASALGAALCGLIAGFLGFATSVAWSASLWVHAVSGLVAIFVVATALSVLAATVFGLPRPWRAAVIAGATAVGGPIALVVGTNLYERVRQGPGEASAAVIQALRSESQPLDTTRPRSDTRDLEPVRAALEGSRVVALGEATHGTAELFQIKHRLVRMLIEEMGFRHFAMETHPVHHGPYLDDFIQGGDSAPERILYWPWATREYMELLEWMRDTNRGRPEADRIAFHGIDPQTGNRDRGMAENVARILEGFPGEKVVVWAANSHVRGARGGAGQYLRDELGDDVYLLGLELHHGSFTSRFGTVRSYQVGPFPPSYYSHALAQLPGQIRFLDFRSMSRHPALQSWLQEPRNTTQLYEGYALYRLIPPLHRVRVPWPELFDGVVYIEESTPPTQLSPRPATN